MIEKTPLVTDWTRIPTILGRRCPTRLAALPTYRLHETTGDDLGRLEHPCYGMIGLTIRSLITLALSGMTALMLAGCAGGNDGGASTTTQITAASIGEIEALVRTRASKSRPVQSVICSAMPGDIVSCVVTFAGPSCQLWVVEGAKTIALPAVDAASGSKTTKGVRCGQSP